MLSLDALVSCLARTLSQASPEPDAQGGYRFDLAYDMRLGVCALPEEGGIVAWSVVAGGRPPEEERERAEAFLRLRLGRVRGAGDIVATLGGEGEFLLYILARPEDEREWLERVGRLLDETEAMRRLLNAGNGGGAGGGPAVMGMSGLFERR